MPPLSSFAKPSATSQPSLSSFVKSATPSATQAQPQPLSESIWSGLVGQIANAAKSGVSQIQQGFQEGQNGTNIASPLEAALKVGAGAVNTIASPLAPITAPISAGVNAIADKVSDIPAVQKFAVSPAGNVASHIAEDVGNASTIAGAVAGAGESASVENALNKTADTVNSTVGNTAAQIAGATTGTGASSIKAAFAGSKGFTDAMRGNITPEHVVQTAQDAVQNIAEARRQTYLSNLQSLGDNTKSLDISPIHDTLNEKLQSFGIKVDDKGELDFSRSSIANNGTARADVQGVVNTLKDWGSQTGDRTPVGLDTLKKQLSDFYSPSGSARALVQAVKSKVSDTLNQVPGYKDMTASYAKASQLLDDIKSATGAGGNAKVDTVFTKMTTAMKGDKDLRLQMLNEMQSQGAQPDLMGQIAGMNMNTVVPKGLMKYADVSAGFGVLSHFIAPQFVPIFLATSPRIVGEFVHAMGMSKDAAGAIIDAVNKYGAKGITGAGAGSPQANLQQKSQE